MRDDPSESSSLTAACTFTKLSCKPFDKSITIDINHVNVIDSIDQSIKIDTHNSSGNYCYRFYRWMSIVDVFNFSH